MPAAGRPEPPPGIWRQLDDIGRAAFPAASTAILMILAAAPLGVPGVVAAVALPCVFFWSVFRPAAMPPPAAFGLGLLMDLLAVGPLGIGILILLVTHGLALRWRGFLVRQSFLLVWLVFCTLAAGVGVLGFVLYALLTWRMPPLVPGLHQFVLTAGLYPTLAFLLTRVHEALRRAEEAA